jgi:putative ABC transport system substrate-binding protein
MAAALSRRRFVHHAAAVGASVAGLRWLAGCGRLPFQVQPPKIPRIGLLSAYPTYHAAIQAFRQELRRRGYVETQNVTIDYRDYQVTREQNSSSADLFTGLVQLQVDVIVVHGTAAVAIAQATPTTIPLVLLATDTGGQRLGLLVAAFPGIAHVAVLWNPASSIGAEAWGEVEAAAGPLGVQLQPQAVSSPEELGHALEAIAQAQADALLVINDPPIGLIGSRGQARRVLDFVAAQRLPAIFPPGPQYASLGGLMVHAPIDTDLFPRAAARVVQLLEDPRQADRTVERGTKFELTVNLATAGALGLTIAPAVLSQATEVIP